MMGFVPAAVPAKAVTAMQAAMEAAFARMVVNLTGSTLFLARTLPPTALPVPKVNRMANQPVETVSTSGDKIKVALAVGAVIAGVVGFFVLAGQPTIVRAAALAGGLLAAIVIAWTSTPGRDFLLFAKDAVRETKKVVWPTRKEAIQLTGIVFAFVVVMAIFLWGADKLIEFVLYDLILGWR
jgi:preprotein translocase subunit SecE